MYGVPNAAPLPSTQMPLAGQVRHECATRTYTPLTNAAFKAFSATRVVELGADTAAYRTTTLESLTVAPASAAMPTPPMWAWKYEGGGTVVAVVVNRLPVTWQPMALDATLLP